MSNLNNLFGNTQYLDFFDLVKEENEKNIESCTLNVLTKYGAHSSINIDKITIAVLKSYFAIEIQKEKDNAISIIENSYNKI